MERDYDRRTFELSMRAAVASHYNTESSWFPIHTSIGFYNALNQAVMEVEYTGGFGISIDCAFEPGKSVSFFYTEKDKRDSLTMVPGSCFIQRIDQKRMIVSVPDITFPTLLARLAEKHELGMQLGIDETTYDVMESALQRAMDRDGEKWVHLRDTLIGILKPQSRELPPFRFNNLNDSQNEAVNRILRAREVAVVHGPPGTGKTTTLVEAIIETTRREPQVLVCAPSNAAVDWISEQLLNRGINVLRVGNPLRINKPLLECSYEHRYSVHPDYSDLWAIRKLIREIHQSKTTDKHHRLQSLHRRVEELEERIREDIMQEAEVITCTLIGSANPVLSSRHFGTVFIDEASQALEAACWTAILKADRVVFAGDHQQLPPTIKCMEATKGGLDKTLMQKIVEEKPVAVTLLNIQYRMNEQIMNFSSRWFYEGKLIAAPEVAHRTLAPWDAPLVWVDTSRSQFSERVSASQSRLNRNEANLLLNILKSYVRQLFVDSNLVESTTFGIISPYKAQVGILRRMAAKSRTLSTIRNHLSINTVDGFQGQERDIILISMVRDNEQGNIGFLKDLRRMNVAITRARLKLIIVGNCDTLSKTTFYQELIQYFYENGIVTQAEP
jgi:superfamily I DNA and/or RNA helicase